MTWPRVIVLEDNDVLHLKQGVCSIFNALAEGDMRRKSVNRALLTLEMEVESIKKGGYDHFMQKEIHEQPECIMQVRGFLWLRTQDPKQCSSTDNAWPHAI